MCVKWHRRSRARCDVLAVLSVTVAASLLWAADDGNAPDRDKVLDARVEALVGLADPQADDWGTEIDADRASKALKILSHIYEAAGGFAADEFAELFNDGALVGELRPAPDMPKRVADSQVYRWRFEGVSDTKVEPRKAFEALRDPHGAADVHAHAKVVAVRRTGERSFSTDVYFEAASHGSRSAIEQTATWLIEWRYPPSTAAPANAAAESIPKAPGEPASRSPRIVAIKPIQLTEVRSTGHRYVDCTGGVIHPSEWNEELQQGEAWWYGRTDAANGISFNGREGIAVGDVDGDGLDDVYVCMAGGAPNRLFIQQPDGTVRDRAYAARVPWLDRTGSALIVDMDNDGDQDMVAAIGASVVLSLNDGTGRLFWKCSYKPPTTEPVYSLCAADYDNDGDLDIYACRYVKTQYGAHPPEPYYDANNGPSNFMLRNDNAETLHDVTGVTGLDVNNRRFSLAASWIDYDDDGDVDLYVANDFGRNNLFRNEGVNAQGVAQFVDVAAAARAEDQASGMGTSWADFDQDGDFDLLVSNMFSSAGRRITYQDRAISVVGESDAQELQRLAWGNTLLVNDGRGRFVDQSDHAGIRMGRWAWSGKFVDINNDGLEDMIIPNGWLTNDTVDDL